MLRTFISVVAFATLSLGACNKSSSGSRTASAGSGDGSPAASLCDALPTATNLTINKEACVAIASKHAAADASAVKDICGQIASIYSPADTAKDDDDTKIACYDRLLRKAQTPVLTLDLAAKVCAKLPQPDAGVTSQDLGARCNDEAKTAMTSSPSAGSFVADQCHGIKSMFDQIAAVTNCYADGTDTLSN